MTDSHATKVATSSSIPGRMEHKGNLVHLEKNGRQRRRRARYLKCIGSFCIVCICLLVAFPFILLSFIARLVNIIFDCVVGILFRIAFPLAVRHLYTSRLGYVHVWLLRPPARRRRWRGGGKAHVEEPADTPQLDQDSLQKKHCLKEPSPLNDATAPVLDPTATVSAPPRIVPPQEKTHKQGSTAKVCYHSRLLQYNVISAAHAHLSIFAIPCLTDNYAYLIVHNTGLLPIGSLEKQSGSSVVPTTSTGNNDVRTHTETTFSSEGQRSLYSQPGIKLLSAPQSAKSYDSPPNQFFSPTALKPLDYDATLPCSESLPLTAVLIDACDADAILDALTYISSICYGGRCLKLVAILTTHHHWDHQGGNAGLKKHFGPELKIYGSHKDNVDQATHELRHNAVVSFSENHAIQILAIETPCHTHGSLSFLLYGHQGHHCLFTGDTLFFGGCGAPFEGDPTAMPQNFWRLLRASTPKTVIFPGHEYSVKILGDLMRSHEALASRPAEFFALIGAFFRAVYFRNLPLPVPTLPYSLNEEMKYNPSFRPVRELAKLLKDLLIARFSAHRSSPLALGLPHIPAIPKRPRRLRTHYSERHATVVTTDRPTPSEEIHKTAASCFLNWGDPEGCRTQGQHDNRSLTRPFVENDQTIDIFSRTSPASINTLTTAPEHCCFKVEDQPDAYADYGVLSQHPPPPHASDMTSKELLEYHPILTSKSRDCFRYNNARFPESCTVKEEDPLRLATPATNSPLLVSYKDLPDAPPPLAAHGPPNHRKTLPTQKPLRHAAEHSVSFFPTSQKKRQRSPFPLYRPFVASWETTQNPLHVTWIRDLLALERDLTALPPPLAVKVAQARLRWILHPAYLHRRSPPGPPVSALYSAWPSGTTAPQETQRHSSPCPREAVQSPINAGDPPRAASADEGRSRSTCQGSKAKRLRHHHFSPLAVPTRSCHHLKRVSPKKIEAHLRLITTTDLENPAPPSAPTSSARRTFCPCGRRRQSRSTMMTASPPLAPQSSHSQQPDIHPSSQSNDSPAAAPPASPEPHTSPLVVTKHSFVHLLTQVDPNALNPHQVCHYWHLLTQEYLAQRQNAQRSLHSSHDNETDRNVADVEQQAAMPLAEINALPLQFLVSSLTKRAPTSRRRRKRSSSSSGSPTASFYGEVAGALHNVTADDSSTAGAVSHIGAPVEDTMIFTTFSSKALQESQPTVATHLLAQDH